MVTDQLYLCPSVSFSIVKCWPKVLGQSAKLICSNTFNQHIFNFNSYPCSLSLSYLLKVCLKLMFFFWLAECARTWPTFCIDNKWMNRNLWLVKNVLHLHHIVSSISDTLKLLSANAFHLDNSTCLSHGLELKILILYEIFVCLG